MYQRLIPTILGLLVLAIAPQQLVADTTANTPTEAYLAYHQALQRGHHERALWPYMTTEAREDFESRFTPELRNRMFFMMKASSPRNIEVADVRIENGRATLELVPADPGNRTVGTAHMEQEDGEWKVVDVVWQQR
ncbi:hypothetical protein CAI21_05095 [Alkalilimnicola ehrlichii]|uniref:Uncharacterized protein n=1 Tax=Alkalilimnicola ehrlichii TaxID=351052 RepID=A0A3E0WYC0_9GAMM|nr:DUF4878 domain-containing protein [Alkalilimnicola ehrlichii]RFA30448.1 hypothetical protein CAI21_05095 [Alkalilimnicola ehrlichii]RFA38000.1 hypothetical protein CAL65_06465 [Alkalilimnicola ehrlichii]